MEMEGHFIDRVLRALLKVQRRGGDEDSSTE
jgi:hypothetical protein